jgi:hypothetical protein
MINKYFKVSTKNRAALLSLKLVLNSLVKHWVYKKKHYLPIEQARVPKFLSKFNIFSGNWAMI